MTVLVALLLAFFVLPHPWGVVAVVASIALELAEVWFWIWLSKRRRVVVGVEALIGADGVVVSACRPHGRVRLAGELWLARCEKGAEKGEAVRVVALDGLTLVVEAAAPSAADAAATGSRRRG